MERADDERLVTGYSGRLVVAISVGWLAIQAGRLVLSPLLPAIRADLSVSATAAGFLFTVLWGLYALLQYPGGRLSDSLSRKTVLVGGLALTAAGFGLLGRAPTYAALLGGAVVVGVGSGLYPVAARALLSDLFVERRGEAFGLHASSGDVGGVLAAGLAAVLVGVATWRLAFPPLVVALGAVALAVHAWSREGYVLARPEFAVVTTFRRLLGGAEFRRLLVTYVLFAFTWQSATAFLPTYLLASKSFSPAVATGSFATLFGVGVVVKPLAGGLSDRVPRAALAPALLALGSLSLAGVVLAGSAAAVTLAVVGFAAGLMAFPPVMQAHLMDTFPAGSAGGDLGATRTMYVGLGALGPTAVGVVADAAGYDVAFAGLVACLVGAAAIPVVGR